MKNQTGGMDGYADERAGRSLCIREWPENDRPREKLLRSGAAALSDSELLAILLRTGMKGCSAIDIARQLVERFGTFRAMSQLSISDWRKIKGLGAAKTAQIKAALEIGRRFREDEAKKTGARISSSKDAADLLMPRMRDLKKEVFTIAYMDSKNRIIELIDAAQGTVDRAFPIVREMIQQGLELGAASMICAHNHPSGDPAPSREDSSFTKEVHEAGKLMQVRMLDHLIIGDNRYYSFADEGEI